LNVGDGCGDGFLGNALLIHNAFINNIATDYKQKQEEMGDQSFLPGSWKWFDEDLYVSIISL